MKLTIEGTDYQLDIEQAKSLGLLKEIQTLTIHQTVYNKVEILQNKEGEIVFTLLRQYNQLADKSPWFLYEYDKEGPMTPILGPEAYRFNIYAHLKSLGYELIYPDGKTAN